MGNAKSSDRRFASEVSHETRAPTTSIRISKEIGGVVWRFPIPPFRCRASALRQFGRRTALWMRRLDVVLRDVTGRCQPTSRPSTAELEVLPGGLCRTHQVPARRKG